MKSTQTDAEFVSVTQVATMLGISRQAILQRIESGTLKATRIGTYWAIDIEELVKLDGLTKGKKML